MHSKIKDIDITKNLKTIEWLKAELVDSVAALLKALLKTGNDMIGDAVANIIIIAYLLGRRVGVNFNSIDVQITSKLRTSIDESQEIGQWFGDLADLLNYLESKKR